MSMGSGGVPVLVDKNKICACPLSIWQNFPLQFLVLLSLAVSLSSSKAQLQLGRSMVEFLDLTATTSQCSFYFPPFS
ncbi:hypothetical protein RJT34_06322 [Clitoria ternatea]|uniref:Uncharacterized protein n=1 Tax=Clitoria ternatea TaxID=43366 RepID=A0AAN9K458_CLITE